MNRADAMFVSFDACAYYKLNALMLRGNMFLSICFSFAFITCVDFHNSRVIGCSVPRHCLTDVVDEWMSVSLQC